MRPIPHPNTPKHNPSNLENIFLTAYGRIQQGSMLRARGAHPDLGRSGRYLTIPFSDSPKAARYHRERL